MSLVWLASVWALNVYPGRLPLSTVFFGEQLASNTEETDRLPASDAIDSRTTNRQHRGGAEAEARGARPARRALHKGGRVHFARDPPRPYLRRLTRSPAQTALPEPRPKRWVPGLIESRSDGISFLDMLVIYVSEPVTAAARFTSIIHNPGGEFQIVPTSKPLE